MAQIKKKTQPTMLVSLSELNKSSSAINIREFNRILMKTYFASIRKKSSLKIISRVRNQRVPYMGARKSMSERFRRRDSVE